MHNFAAFGSRAGKSSCRRSAGLASGDTSCDSQRTLYVFRFLHLNSRGGVAMNRFLSILCCTVLCSVPAFAQKAAGSAAMTDQQFVDMAAQTDMVEANLGQLAQDAASSQAVKQYGQMLVTDHTADYGKLQGLASQANVTIPTAIDAAHNKMMITPF